MEIPLLQGRTFTELDHQDARPVVIIDEAFARRHFSSQDPVGRRIAYGESAYKREFGYVPEDPFFYEDMTVRGLLDFNARFYPRWDRKSPHPIERCLDPVCIVR
jgi:hypothetical protein